MQNEIWITFGDLSPKMKEKLTPTVILGEQYADFA